MVTGAADLMFRHVFEGSLSMCDTDIERRPYHRNCTCALHKKKATCPNAVLHSRIISFPKKELWNKCSLISVSASTVSSRSSYVADSSVSSSECIKFTGEGLILFSVLKSSGKIPSG
ncbi:unnamed protein product [Fraxinus pennsylvanica]|uniref:Uncharacterized protein n=1 Tax=Fraxinus pennsylvanica TaxID=56036 RepID=A0AAD2A7L2_9LAMI|nr:unnamed protein product [Fraxinus pennsylvanica]